MMFFKKDVTNLKWKFGCALLGAVFLSTGIAGETGSSSPYGVCAHLNRMPERERKAELGLMKKTGIRFFRTDMDWAQVEKTKGKWDFKEWDSVVKEAKKLGLQPVAILGGNLPKHSSPPFRHLDAWKQYVETVVKRYRNDIFFYEVINEADCDRPWGMKPDAENYAALLRESCEIIKRINPQATVLFTGVSDFHNPLTFVEEALRSGAGNYFDVMNFHPYQWKNEPEAQLMRRVQDLRAVMDKYDCEKPIWITEIGNSTAPVPANFTRTVIPAALKELKFDLSNLTIGIVADHEWFYYTDGFNMKTTDFLPPGMKRKEFTFKEIESADVKSCPVIFLPGVEGFPMEVFHVIRDYVKRGGTIVISGGLPFYYNLERMPDGSFRKGQLVRNALPQLHIAWETFWTKPGVPSKTSSFEPGERFKGLKPKKCEALRFLTKDNLKEGDVMIPVIYGVEGSYKAPVAAIYQLNSDLKGNIVLVTNLAGFETTTEGEQGKLLPRQYLLAGAAGVQKIFWYSLRSGEWNNGREAHFGIYRRNMKSKPGALAYRTLAELRPEGSSPIALTAKNPVYCASWSTPDGKKIYALWLVHGKKELNLNLKGSVKEIRNHLGEQVKRTGDSFSLSEGPTYVIGESDLLITLP